MTGQGAFFYLKTRFALCVPSYGTLTTSCVTQPCPADQAAPLSVMTIT